MRSLVLSIALGVMATAGPVWAEEGWPRDITHETGVLTLETPPQRIVSTSPSLTGILLAIDAPVHASATAVRGTPLTDDIGFFSQWSQAAKARGVEVLYTDLAFDLEAVILSEPDLIIASKSGGDTIVEHIPTLEAMGLQVVTLDYGFSAWEKLAEQLGTVTGRESAAAEVIEDFQARIAQIGQTIEPHEGGASIISYNFFGSYGVSKVASAQGLLLSDLGFDVKQVPDDLSAQINSRRDFDFMSHENLPAAILGETVFLLAADEDDVATFMADPILANLPAAQKNQVYALGPTSFRVDYYSGLQMAEQVATQFAR